MKKLITITTALFAASPALAHHPLAGAKMETFMHGMLSGVGHPLLGFDHLFFVALVGIVGMYTARHYSVPLAFISAMLIGTLFSSFGFAIPATEIMIIISLLALGGIVAAGRKINLKSAMILFAITGLFHPNNPSSPFQTGSIHLVPSIGWVHFSWIYMCLSLGVTEWQDT